MRSRLSVLLACGALSLAAPPPAALAAADCRVVHVGTPHDAMYDIAFDGPEGVAVGLAAAVFTTPDGGRTWSEAPSPPTDLALLGVATAAGQRLVVGQRGQAFRWDGAGWTAAETGTEERIMQVDVTKDGVAVAVGAFGAMIRSDDFGRTWQPIRMAWEDILEDGYEPHLYAVHIDGAAVTVGGEFGLVLRSLDAGLTWSVAYQAEASIFDLSINDSGRGLAVGQDGFMLATEDGGATWHPQRAAVDANLLGVWLAADRAVAVGIRSVLVSDDAGATWRDAGTCAGLTTFYQSVDAPEGQTGPVIVGENGRIVVVSG